MSDSTQDIRVIKTRRSLMSALLQLLEKTPFIKISVNDICQEALVSRSTFYVHFEDKFSLLQFCLEEIRLEFQQKGMDCGPREKLQVVLETIQSNARVFRNLILAEMNREVVQMFQEHFYETMLQILTIEQEQGRYFDTPLSFVAIFFSGGLANTLLWWIGQNFPTPAEEVANYHLNLLESILPPIALPGSAT